MEQKEPCLRRGSATYSIDYAPLTLCRLIKYDEIITLLAFVPDSGNSHLSEVLRVI